MRIIDYIKIDVKEMFNNNNVVKILIISILFSLNNFISFMIFNDNAVFSDFELVILVLIYTIVLIIAGLISLKIESAYAFLLFFIIQYFTDDVSIFFSIGLIIWILISYLIKYIKELKLEAKKK